MGVNHGQCGNRILLAKQKLSYVGHVMKRNDGMKKELMLVRGERKRRVNEITRSFQNYAKQRLM